MVEIAFIRHGKTEGNLFGRYIGTTDEPLCAKGIRELKKRAYPEAELLFTSSMRRCVETGALIYPKLRGTVIEDLRECDFGDFENKNYRELDGNEDYQHWIDSKGILPFPNGEGHEEFKERCCKGFLKAIAQIEEGGIERAAFVIHGGSMMSILENHAYPCKEFYDWQSKNGRGFLLQLEPKVWIRDKRLMLLSTI